jgi:transcriptional regulator with XRE-family HTH domain
VKINTKQSLESKSDAKLEALRQRPSSLPELGRRLLALYDAVGTRLKAAEIAGRSTDQLAKWAKGHAEPPFAPLAKLCKAAGVSLEWLAFEEGKGPRRIRFGQGLDAIAEAMALETAPPSQSQPVRREELTMAFQLLDEALEGKTLPPAKRAELVELIYEGLVDGLPEGKVLRWARTAAG